MNLSAQNRAELSVTDETSRIHSQRLIDATLLINESILKLMVTVGAVKLCRSRDDRVLIPVTCAQCVCGVVIVVGMKYFINKPVISYNPTLTVWQRLGDGCDMSACGRL